MYFAANQLLQATWFASEKHTHQRRKNAAQTPYIEHPIGVAAILAECGVASDDPAELSILIAALLHDTVEDTDTTWQELARFSAETVQYVRQVTDDKSLPKDYTNLQLARMPFFWESVFDISRAIEADYQAAGGTGSAIEFYRLNFGQWESAMANDFNALECHGHLHFILNKEAQQVLKETEKYRALYGRFSDVEDYDLHDALTLEQRHLLSTEVNNLSETVQGLSVQLEGLSKKLDEKFDLIIDMLKKE